MQGTAVHERGPSRLRYHISRNLNLFLVKALRVPRLPAQRISRAVNIGLSPFAYLPRSNTARSIALNGSSPIRIDAGQAYCMPDLHQLPTLGPAIRQAMAVYEQARQSGRLDSGEADAGTGKKPFLAFAAQGSEIARYLDIMRLALERPIVDAVATYLGSVPLLNSLSIMVSLPNASEIASQLYHLDFADERQVKLFVNVDEVSSDHGPFTFVAADKSAEIIRKLGYDRGRLRIDEVELGGRERSSDRAHRSTGYGLDDRLIEVPPLRIQPEQKDKNSALSAVYGLLRS